jgi:carbonic anhydrase
MSDSHFSIYLGRNVQFAATDAKDHVPETPFIPHKQLYLITCIDPRVEPAAIVGSQLGEAIVARNVGGRVTPTLIKDLLWILHLHENLTPDADWFEIALIHHTDCGSGLMARDDLRSGYVARGGWDDETALEMAVIDPAKSVEEDVRKLRAAPELQPTINNVKVGGYAYDLKTGKVTTVIEPAQHGTQTTQRNTKWVPQCGWGLAVGQVRQGPRGQRAGIGRSGPAFPRGL